MPRKTVGEQVQDWPGFVARALDLPREVVVRQRPACHGDLQPGSYCADCGAYNPGEDT